MLSKETQEQIRKEAEVIAALTWFQSIPIKDREQIRWDHGQPGDGILSENKTVEVYCQQVKEVFRIHILEKPIIEKLTAWAVWKEKAEGYEKALKEIRDKEGVCFPGGPVYYVVAQEIATKALEQFK